MKWGMVINLKKCVGCYACQIACKQENFLPPDIFWARVLIGESENPVRKRILPVLCNHCEEAPCVEVCPTGASSRREDGIVTIDQDRCIGCEYCIVACPYQHRTYLDEEAYRKEYFPGQGLTPCESLGKELKPLKPGTAIKCHFCKEKIDNGLSKGLKPGEDIEATPACVTICPAKARHFGDLDDQESEVHRIIVSRKGSALRPEFNTKPSVYYLE